MSHNPMVLSVIAVTFGWYL